MLMKLMSELIPLRLYPSKRKVFIPLNETNKRKGSAIFLMGSTQESNEMMMQLPYLHQKQYYRSYYIDRNVMAYIKSSDGIPAEEFDEVQEAAISEAMFHTSKPSKITIDNASTMDERRISGIINDGNVKYIINTLKVDTEIKDITVKVHPSISSLNEDKPKAYKKLQVNSYSTDDTIHVLSSLVYDEKTMDGPYDMYLMNELICFILMKENKYYNPLIVFAAACVFSGQLEWFKKEKNVDHFEYSDNAKYGINELYFAEVISSIYKQKGMREVRKVLNGNLSSIRLYATKNAITKISKMFKESLTEGTLSSEERKSLSDKDFGLPDKRKYPMPDEDHVRSAIRFFNHCDKEDEEELASAIKRKMKKFGMKDVSIGKDNRLSKYIHESLNESADEVTIDGVPHIELDYYGNPFMGNKSKEYLDVLAVCDDLDYEEFRRISFNEIYKDLQFIEKRIIFYDVNKVPMCFMDVYHFPSSPDKAQITTAVARSYRGHGYCAKMLKELLDSKFAEEHGIKEYIWHVHPGNVASEKAAMSGGFIKYNDDLDKYGRMTYRLAVDPPDFEVMQSTNDGKYKWVKFSNTIKESSVVYSDNTIEFFNEAASTAMGDVNDAKFKKWLYKERMKNARALIPIYTAVKSRNPSIDRTFREIKLYKGLNVFIDTSYYHEMYLTHAYKGTKRSLYMYYDFFLRLMENDEVKSLYSKITYFIPIVYPKGISSVDSLLDYKADMNIFSAIMYFIRRDPDMLKKLAGKDIVFLGKNGYFKIDFASFGVKNIARFKRNMSMILSGGEIPDEDPEEDGYDDANSTKAIAVKVIDRIDNDSTNIKINDISGIESINISHLKLGTDIPEMKDTKAAIFIVAPDSTSSISEVKDKSVPVFYKPR